MVRAGPHQVAHAYSDQRLGSAISNDSTSRQQSDLSDFTNVQADLGLCCPYMPWLPLSHNTTRFLFTGTIPGCYRDSQLLQKVSFVLLKSFRG